MVENVEFRKAVTNIPSTTFGAFGLYRYPAKFIPQVVSYALDKYGFPGCSVFDPFLGSGTTAIACLSTGRNYIGIEKEPAYVSIANRRIAQYNMQCRMDF
jgi:DNA modification methylase